MHSLECDRDEIDEKQGGEPDGEVYSESGSWKKESKHI